MTPWYSNLSRQSIITGLVGDRIGATLFVGVCLLYGTFWHAGFLLNDSWTIANTLVGVADGHLYMDRVVYGTYFGTPGDFPGTHIVEQRLYGRNYGQLVFALPIYWLLTALVELADLRVLLAALWSLGVILFGHQLGTLTDRYAEFVSSSCLIALAIFYVNVWQVTELDTYWIPQLALQLSTIIATAILVVVLYRLIQDVTDRRTATVLATVIAVSTPVAFWSTLPKRHAFTALLVTLIVYSFVRSRNTASQDWRFRALAYGWVGILTWINAAEGLAVLFGLGIVDILTARNNTPRRLSAIGIVFGVSLVPFFLTNALVTGNPLLPPNLWPNFDGTQPVILNGELVNVADGTDSPPPQTGNAGQNGAIVQLLLSTFTDGLLRLTGQIESSVFILLSEPRRIVQIFFRSGWYAEQARDQQAINLTFLETAPLYGAILSLPMFVRRITPSDPRTWSVERQTDLLVVGLGLFILFLYLPRLPIHAQFTVRYLHPLVPLLGYALARVPPVRTIVHTRLSVLLWSYATGMLLGGQLMVALLAIYTGTVGDAIQLHGVLNLGFAGLLAISIVGCGLDRATPKISIACAITFGLAAASGTVTMLFLLWNHLAYGDAIFRLTEYFRLIVPP